MHPPLTPQREKYLLLTLAGIQFSHVLDFMIMMPLGPMLMSAFGISTHEFGLLVASYSFSAALSGLFAATFVDRFERKRLLLGMFALFGLATLACGLAPGYATLLIARGLAGAFGGVMGALIQTMVGDVIPFARRASASGAVSLAFSISTVAGVPLSLWLANYFQWRAPFLFIAVLVVLFILIGMRVLPELRQHINPSANSEQANGHGEQPPPDNETRHARFPHPTLPPQAGEGANESLREFHVKRTHPFTAMFAVLRDPNHLRALLFSALVIFSGFTVIPYITIYAVGNVGIAQQDIPYIYLFGGAATLVTARRIGRWADLHGKVRVYRLVASAALLPLLVVTHIGAVPLWLWLVCTTAFFVLVSGRMIPAMAIITSSVQPKLRGTFMSLNATTQSLAMGLATTLAGFIITQDAGGRIVDYGTVGYVAAAANLLAVWFVARITMHDQHAVVLDVAPK